MMTIIDSYLVESLYLMKQMHDGGMERVMDIWRSSLLDGDYCSEMAFEAMCGVFADTKAFYNAEKEFEIIVFCDPLIDTFCRLCEEYEQRRGIEPKENPHRKDAENAIRSGLTFNSYSYDYTWYLEPQERGRRRIILFFDPEFYCTSDVPAGLLEIRDALKYQVKRLREALRDSNVTPLPLPMLSELKEAA